MKHISKLLKLIKRKARCNAIQLQKTQKNPEKYDEEFKKLIELEADALDNNKNNGKLKGASISDKYRGLLE